ncbi:MAG: ATP-binding protein [Cyanobacteria bacterium P01_G01_bin.54]
MNILNSWEYITQEVGQLLQSYIEVQQQGSNLAKLPSLNQFFITHQLHEISLPSTLQDLSQHFNLSPFEQWVILLAIVLDLEPFIGELYTKLQGNGLNQPTPNLAHQLFSAPQWQAFNSNAPLLYWQLIKIKDTQPFSLSPLSIDRPLFFWLIGESYHDPQLQDFIQPLQLDIPIPLTATQTQLAQTLSQAWTHPQQPSLQQLIGNDPQAHRAILHTVAQLSSFRHSTPLTNEPHPLRNLARRWERAARLTHSVLLLECQDVDLAEPTSQITLKTLLGEWQTPIILSAAEPIRLPNANSQTHEVPPATHNEREIIWLHCLGEQASPIIATLAQIADQFPLTPQQIVSLTAQLPLSDTPQDLSKNLWQACRQVARPQLQDLAQCVTTRLTWDDLVFPEKTSQELKGIVAAVRQRTQVYQDWGFAKPEDRGLGIIALFSGYSGTGKTTAAEIIARELELDCYRIDLSNIVNKYIGETEKNLKRVFDAAEGSGAMLLFDEADAIFGMRGEVKEARDRYANQEVSYLLQRLETYPGLVILTTNLKDSIDDAFMRRLRYLVEFPTPKTEERQVIWQQVFPNKVPTDGLHYRRLAELNVTGANIRNIALTAAFLAADAGESVTMELMLQAARAEYKKLGRSLSSTESAALRMKPRP